jgi:hypothetical protein
VCAILFHEEVSQIDVPRSVARLGFVPKVGFFVRTDTKERVFPRSSVDLSETQF